MSDPDESRPNPWLLRASDSDREQYVSLLQTAFLEGRLTRDEYEERMGAAYQAVTYADLAPLLADLPVPRDKVPGPPVGVHTLPAGGTSVVSAGSGLDHWRVVPGGVRVDQAPLVAIFGEVARDGRWAVPGSLVTVASFGGVRIDLRHAMLESSTIEIKAVAIFGGVEITVPADLRLDVTGTGIFGAFTRKDDRPAAERGNDAPPGTPLVRVTGVALFGGVVVTVAPAEAPAAPPSPPALPPAAHPDQPSD